MEDPSHRAPERIPTTWDPFSAFHQMRRQLDEFMQGVLGQQRGGGWRPTVEVEEDDRSFTIRIELPGWTEQDVTVEVDQNILTVRGQRDGDGTHSTTGGKPLGARGSRSFIQSLTLPPTIVVDQVTAQLTCGLLSVHLPKQPQASPKRIPITQAARSEPREPAGG